VKTNEKAIVYWALQYGEHIELVYPSQIREKIEEAIESLVKRYK